MTRREGESARWHRRRGDRQRLRYQEHQGDGQDESPSTQADDHIEIVGPSYEAALTEWMVWPQPSDSYTTKADEDAEYDPRAAVRSRQAAATPRRRRWL